MKHLVFEDTVQTGDMYGFSNIVISLTEHNANELKRLKELFLKIKELDSSIWNATNIVWGIPNSGKYRVWGYGAKANLAEMYKTPHGKKQVEDLIKKVKAELKDGEVIINTNIPLS